MYATSSALRCVFTSTTEPCNFATAAHTSKNATEFGSIERDPVVRADASRREPRAMRSVRASKSMYVVVQVVLDERGLLGSARRDGGRAKLGELHPPSVEVP